MGIHRAIDLTKSMAFEQFSFGGAQFAGGAW